MATSEIEKLKQKRAEIDAAIEQELLAEKRKDKVLKLLQKAKILHLPDEVLSKGFAEIAKANS